MQYPIAPRALDAWWKFDMRRRPLEGGAVRYTYRMVGSTCTNAGMPIETLMHAELRPAPEGLVVERAWIEFAEDDEGHRRMCEYIQQGPEFVEALKRPAPFCGRTLEAAI